MSQPTNEQAGKPPGRGFALTKAKTTFLLVAIAGVCIGGMVFPSCRILWQFEHLEKNARQVITPGELQAWATNLLSQYPTNAMELLYPADLGTKFPRKLLRLYHRPPSIFIYGAGTEGDVPHLSIMWGGGFIGHTGLEIGPTNFQGMRGTNYWAPGIYSFKQL